MGYDFAMPPDRAGDRKTGFGEATAQLDSKGRTKEVKIMVIKITPKQSKRINALIKKLCCNYVDGSCLLLDDGEEHACVQCISRYGIYCNYFKNAVLTADRELFAEIMQPASKKTMQNLQVVLRIKGKEPALLPGLCRRPKAEESRRAPAQETGSAVSSRFQDGVLTRDTVLRL